jgi:4-hydroxy-3-methylbut-2-en-1-yl diphosphate reductase
MDIHIDKNSGFCFGVLKAIAKAEEQLKLHGTLFCLGDIVHNNKEVERLSQLGLMIINHSDLKNIYNSRVLVRAHGEPPTTYETAKKNGNIIIEASCPVVLKLQKKIKATYEQTNDSYGQIVIFGKEGHAEVLGLMGQTSDTAIIIGNDFANIDQIDFNKPITLFSQTTQDKEAYEKLKEIILEKYKKSPFYSKTDSACKSFDSICGQVSNRGPRMAEFSKNHDVIIFVSGKKSSNGKYLFDICFQNNPSSYFISDKAELQKEWFTKTGKVGVCGATSTPMWLMEEVADEIKEIGNKIAQ